MNEESLSIDSIESLNKINTYILIGDIGLSDESISKLNKFKNLTIKKISKVENNSYYKNQLIDTCTTDWILFLNSGELLEKFTLPEQKDVYRCSLINQNIITKEIRFWHKSKKVKFVNPIYENIKSNSSSSNIWIKSNIINYNSEILKKWKEIEPLNNSILYYEAMEELKNGNYDNFVNKIQCFIFNEKTPSLALLMSKYYFAQVLLKKKNKQCLTEILECLFTKPVMAEFWCLLGDFFYIKGEWSKAKIYYQNAIIMGQKRNFQDDTPVEVLKYKKYPNQMIESCINSKNTEKLYFKLNPDH